MPFLSNLLLLRLSVLLTPFLLSTVSGMSLVEEMGKDVLCGKVKLIGKNSHMVALAQAHY